MAVTEEIKLAPAPFSKPCRRRSLGVKLGRFKAVVGDIGQKGNIVFLGHGVIYRQQKSRLDISTVTAWRRRLFAVVGALHPAAHTDASPNVLMTFPQMGQT